jgi:hypothetical protein
VTLTIARIPTVETVDDAIRIDLFERARVADCLDDATAILLTTATAPDLFAPELGERVGLNVRSDGAWVWSDVVSYYVREHGIIMDRGLLDHVRTAGYVCAVVGADDAGRLLDELYDILDQQS